MLDKEKKVKEIIDYVEKNNISAYSIAKATKVSEAGIGKILNKSSKNPRDLTIDAIYYFLFESEGGVENDVENDIEVLYAEHIAFKKALSVIKDKGVKAYEIHKKTGLNQSGLRRILNKEIDNPQRKTRQVIIDFAESISPEQENVDFRDLKIDDKLNVIYNQIQKINEGNKAISTMTEDIAFNNEMICKLDRSLMVYKLNAQAAIKQAKEEKSKIIKLS